MTINPDPVPVPPEPTPEGCVWDDATRTVTCYDADGVATTRPYDDSENQNADAVAEQALEEQRAATISAALNSSLATLQAIIDDTNANINTNPASRIKDMARVQRGVIRLVIRRLDGVS